MTTSSPAEKNVVSGRPLTGDVRVPPDKSITHRAVLLSSLAKGRSVIENPLQGADCLSTLHCVEALGCEISMNDGVWEVTGRGLKGYRVPKDPLDCGNSGTTMRLLSGILAAQSFASELVGDPSLSKRPMARVANPLRQMGASITLSEDRYPPIRIEGRALSPIEWTNPVSSAQVKSCVLLAALHTVGTTQYTEPTLSRDHTERMLERCGAPIRRNDVTTALTGPFEPAPSRWIVPSDFSSAAFFLAAAALVPGSNLQISNVNLNPTRTGLLRVLEQMGANITVSPEEGAAEPSGTLAVQFAGRLRPPRIERDAIPTLIDEIPIVAVLAAYADGVTELSGLEELRVKETDRISAMASNLKKMGVEVEEKPDGLRIAGRDKLAGAVVESFADHRIAMAFAIAGLAATGTTRIVGSEAVSVSYPAFWSDLDKVAGGGVIR